MSPLETLKDLRIGIRRLRHPQGLKAGRGSYIRAPFEIPFGNGISLGERTTVGRHALMSLIKNYGSDVFEPKIYIGNDVYIGSHLYLVAVGEITIGDGCVLSDYVNINDASHGLDPTAGPIMQQRLVFKGPIRIGQNCFLGFRSAILSGVSLGEGCVVGINSVVTKSFPAYSMIAGAPARVVRTFDHASKSWIGNLQNSG
jgi:acetyltransferase-like isoleucine patch superfamily enzyme